MRGCDTDNNIRQLFESFLHNYQEELKKIKGKDFNFKKVELLNYKLHRVWLKRDVSYIESPVIDLFQ